MTSGLFLASGGLALAAIPAILFRRNLSAYAPPPPVSRVLPGAPAVSVLIPARNEEHTIREAVQSALASEFVTLEVIVLDDGSQDGTAAAVQELATQDPRLRLSVAPPLPAGWCGKQHACAVLAQLAQYDLLCFLDADVRLTRDGLARLAAFQHQSRAALVSGFPRQETVTFLEKLLLPFMHFLLLGFLPINRMRHDRQPAFGAGCGQLFFAERRAYENSGGHTSIRTSLHDGLTLPKAFRRSGYLTDLCDLTTVARCRMYRSAGEVWRGLSKNATEGIAAPARILPFTILLVWGQVLPLLLLLLSLAGKLSPAAGVLSAVALVLAHYPRIAAVIRFRQPLSSALLHVPGLLVLLALQWMALLRHLFGAPQQWKGRDYRSTSPADARAMTGAGGRA